MKPWEKYQSAQGPWTKYQSAQPDSSQPTQQQLQSDVPMMPEDVAKLTPEQQAQYYGTQPDKQYSPAEKAVGLAEQPLQLVANPILRTLGQTAGATAGLVHYLLHGDYSKPPQNDVTQSAEAGANMLTIPPLTEAGKQYTQTAVNAIEPVANAAMALAPMAPEMAALRSGLNQASTALQANMPSKAPREASLPPDVPAKPAFEMAKKPALREALQQNTTESAGWKISPQSNRVVPNMLERNLIQDMVPEKTIVSLRNMPKTEKTAATQMLNIAENHIRNTPGSQTVAPSVVPGQRLMARFDKLKGIQENASKQIGKAVQNDLKGKQINISDIKDNFASNLENQGAVVTNKGVNFKDLSGFEPTDKRLINETYRMLSRDSVDGADLHRAKMAISKRLNYTNNPSATKLSDAAENMLKNVRSQINDKLRENSSQYAQANDNFSKAASGIGPFMEAIGKKFDPESTRVENFTGTQLRKMLSNYSNGEQMIEAVHNLNDVANSFPGKKFGNEIIPLVRLNSDLEGILGSFKPQNFQSNISKGMAELIPRHGAGMFNRAVDAATTGTEELARHTSWWDAPVTKKLDIINRLKEQVNSK